MSIYQSDPHPAIMVSEEGGKNSSTKTAREISESSHHTSSIDATITSSTASIELQYNTIKSSPLPFSVVFLSHSFLSLSATRLIL